MYLMVNLQFQNVSKYREPAVEQEGYTAESFFRFLGGSGPFSVQLQVCCTRTKKIK